VKGTSTGLRSSWGGKAKKADTWPRKPELNVQQQKGVTQVRLENEQSSEELWLLFSKYKVESVLFIFAFLRKLPYNCHSEEG